MLTVDHIPKSDMSTEFEHQQFSLGDINADVNGNSNDCMSKAAQKSVTTLEQLPPIPEGLEPLKHQLAGHKFGHISNSDLYGILDCKDGTILKPMLLMKKGQREMYFYELINGEYNPNRYFRQELYNLDIIRRLADFTPKFFGSLTIPEHPNVTYVKMADICYGLVKPHTLDVKIGAICWEPSASLAKQQRQKLRCPYLEEIQFQILGARYYDADTGEEVVKHNLRQCSPHDLLHSGLYDIFKGVPREWRNAVLEQVLGSLNSISNWFASQTYLSFHGSSLLIAFDGEPDDLNDFLPALGSHLLRRIAHVKMIDFVHVRESSHTDQNYLGGINSLINYINSLSKIFNG